MTTHWGTRRLARLVLTGLLLTYAVPGPGQDEGGTNLARIHEQNDEFDLAIEQYMEDISALEASEGPFSMGLVEPLTGLGRSYLATGDLPQAEEALRRAQHVTHRNRGVLSLTQLPVIDILTDKFLLQAQPLEADRQQRLALFISERFYGKDSPEVLPALDKMADWYLQTGQYDHARTTLERMIDIAQNDGGKYDLRALEPLERIATARRLQGICCSYRSLETAREIVENNPAADTGTRIRVYLALADAYLVSGKGEQAHEFYRAALGLAEGENREMLLATPQRIAMSETLYNHRRSFKRYYRVDRESSPYNLYGQYRRLEELSPEEQLMLDHQPPQEFVLTKDDRLLNLRINNDAARLESVDPVTRMAGQPFKFHYSQLRYILPFDLQSQEEIASLFITLSFDVDTDGDVHNVEIVDTNAPLKLQRLMLNVVSKAVFRPAYEGMQPVETTGVTLTQNFPVTFL